MSEPHEPGKPRPAARKKSKGTKFADLEDGAYFCLWVRDPKRPYRRSGNRSAISPEGGVVWMSPKQSVIPMPDPVPPEGPA